jgi:hypothetical protein
MKETRSLINSLLVCGVAFAMVSTLPAQTTKEEFAKVIRVHGAARYQAPGGSFQELRVGTVIQPGSVVQSGIEASSFVDLALGGGTGAYPSFGSSDNKRFSPTAHYSAQTKRTVLHLYANTVLGVDKMVATETGAATVTDTELDLRKGHILGSVKKLSAGSEFRIRYPKGVAGLRGSIFDMTVDYVRAINQPANAPGEQVHCTFAMTSGTGVVTFTGPDGAAVTQTVQTMQMFDSSNPSVTMTIPTTELDNINSIVSTLSAPPTGVVHLPEPGEVEIQFNRITVPTVTTTVGMVQ